MCNPQNFDALTSGEEVVKMFAGNARNKTYVITGPSTGSIAAEVALNLVRHAKPRRLILLGRDASKVKPIQQQIESQSATVEVLFFHLELTSEESIRDAAEKICQNNDIERVDCLINCAGVMAIPYASVESWTAGDGSPVETQFAVNHLGHFLLTALLLPKILPSGVTEVPEARIIFVSSAGHRFSEILFDDIGFSCGKTYDAWKAYAQSKTANILTAKYLGSRVSSDKIVSLSVHPGSVPTYLGRYMTDHTRNSIVSQFSEIPNMEPFHRKTLEQGSSTVLVAALDTALRESNGCYLSDCHVYEPADFANNIDYAERLCQLSEKALGVKLLN